LSAVVNIKLIEQKKGKAVVSKNLLMIRRILNGLVSVGPKWIGKPKVKIPMSSLAKFIIGFPMAIFHAPFELEINGKEEPKG